ncbi:unnamed protein product [Dibothriocephalus latus]|uniref:LicD/FKTN/FKRP nucleotidyltransferase domain-containing protein n=1 Tax=Dibothriocephalus latus TaxID=60516 RepID=A0A3P6SBM7_DIBLA|nr:unnamed protein product [Dibothriocephalus latus]
MDRRRFLQFCTIFISVTFLILSYRLLETSLWPLNLRRNVNCFHKTESAVEFQNYIVDSGHIAVKRRKLPNLENINWPEREFLSIPMGAKGSSQLPLQATFSRGQLRTLWKLFSAFITAMEELSFSDRWMLYGGTLLGSFRYHDIIPWDDDIDVLVDLEDADGCHKISGNSWGWPFLDVSYYSSNQTHIKELAWSFGRFYRYARSDVFPLLLRPFNKYWVPTPRNTLSVLLQTYGPYYLCSG